MVLYWECVFGALSYYSSVLSYTRPTIFLNVYDFISRLDEQLDAFLS